MINTAIQGVPAPQLAHEMGQKLTLGQAHLNKIFSIWLKAETEAESMFWSRVNILQRPIKKFLHWRRSLFSAEAVWGKVGLVAELSFVIVFVFVTVFFTVCVIVFVFVTVFVIVNV